MRGLAIAFAALALAVLSPGRGRGRRVHPLPVQLAARYAAAAKLARERAYDPLLVARVQEIAAAAGARARAPKPRRAGHVARSTPR